ncbi:unnamed protein product [Amoebophrya sp. A25]|nr:unnamed protein product [Amoebophrya sp. A25]|eukprot:GSA25T00009089001.1
MRYPRDPGFLNNYTYMLLLVHFFAVRLDFLLLHNPDTVHFLPSVRHLATHLAAEEKLATLFSKESEPGSGTTHSRPGTHWDSILFSGDSFFQGAQWFESAVSKRKDGVWSTAPEERDLCSRRKHVQFIVPTAQVHEVYKGAYFEAQHQEQQEKGSSSTLPSGASTGLGPCQRHRARLVRLAFAEFLRWLTNFIRDSSAVRAISIRPSLLNPEKIQTAAGRWPEVWEGPFASLAVEDPYDASRRLVLLKPHTFVQRISSALHLLDYVKELFPFPGQQQELAGVHQTLDEGARRNQENELNPRNILRTLFSDEKSLYDLARLLLQLLM